MATVRTDNVQIKLDIDGSQSKTELDNLTRKAQLLKEDMKGLKKSSQEYIDANKQLGEVGTRIKELRQELGLSALSYNQLSTLSRQLNRELRDLTPGTETFIAKSRELQEVDAHLKRVQGEIKGIGQELELSTEDFDDFVQQRDELGLVSLSLGQLKGLTHQLREELDELTPGTEAFLSKSQELQQAETRLEQVKDEARGVGEQLDQSGDGFLSFVKKSAAFAGIHIGIESAVEAVRELGRESVDAAAKGSDSIADMEKSLNVTTQEAHALREQLEGIDTRTSQENLESIAVAAGQLGIAKQDAEAFVGVVDQANVALGDEFTGGVAEVTKSLGGLQKLFKETAELKPDQAYLKIGSAVNALGADGMASGPVIAEFTARIGQLGNLAPQISQTLGLGAAMQELGLSAEISSGGLTNVLLTATKDTAGFAQQLGMTEEQFKQLVNSDPNEVILRLADSLKGASETKIISTLDALGIKSQEATKVMSLLATQTDFVRQKQALAATEFEKGTSLTDEFAKKNATAAAEVEKAEKRFAAYRRELGEQLIPIYIRFLQVGGLVIDVLRALPKFLSDNKVGFALLALAVLSWNAALIKSQVETLKDLALKKLAELQINSMAQAQWRLNAAMTANPIGAVIAVLALAAFALKQLYDRSETFRASVDALFGMLKPLGQLFEQLAAELTPVAQGFKQLFDGLGIGKGILELFGFVVKTGVVLPLQLMVTQVQLTVDALLGLWDVGKRVANFFGADFQVDPNGSFDQLAKNAKRNGQVMLDTITGGDLARAQQEQGNKAALAYQHVLEQKLKAQYEAERKQKEAAAKSAADRATEEEAESRTSLLHQLQLRQVALQRQLVQVKEGSDQELALKKQLVLVARDIELADAKKTVDDKLVVHAKAQLELDKLNADYRKKRAADDLAADEKAAQLRRQLLTDETERKVADLTAAAAKETAAVKGSAEKQAEQRRLLEQNLVRDVAEVRRAAAQKQLEEDLALEQQRNGLIVDAWQRREAQLRTAAKQEEANILDSDRLAAEKRRLIAEKLQQDLAALARERVAVEAEVARRIEAGDADLALRRATRARDEADRRDFMGREAIEAAQVEKAARLDILQDELLAQLSNEQLTINQRLALWRQYHQDKADIENGYALGEADRQRGAVQFMGQVTGMALGALADFAKLAGERELIRLEKEKKARLSKLDDEYRLGKVSKENYEKQKSGIEAQYLEKARAEKRRTAQEEKKWNVAQSVMLGILSVLMAKTLPEKIIAGIAAAIATAKVVATPVPEFAFGGVWGGAKSLWSGATRRAGDAWRSAKRYASGGRINSVAGVAEVGQRHSGGGIQMVDGATGQHLGEWERGEPYMILSRATYANNREVIDELIDTSLYRGGAPISRRRGASYFEDGGVQGERPDAGSRGGDDYGPQMVAAIKENTAAVRALPSRQYIGWRSEDTGYLEDALQERQDIRNESQMG